MNADPLFLEKGYEVFRAAMIGPTKGARTLAGLRAFASYVLCRPGPRPVGDALVEAAIKQVEESTGWCPLTPAGVRAMLEAAERVRSVGMPPCRQPGCGTTRACCRVDCPIVMVEAQGGSWRWDFR